jgi:TolB protein
MKNFNINKLAIFIFCLFPSLSFAQTDLKISGAQTVFPIAIPQLCDAGGGKDVSKKIANTLTKDLDLSGIFQIIDPKTFIESPGKCLDQNQIAFSDWSVIGADSLIKGEVDSSGFSGITVKMYLYDVQRKTAVLGKKYSGGSDDADLIAHKFANEVMKFFTGEYGVFGSQIAYVARDGRYKEIHRMGMDGSNSGQLTDMNSLSISPDWSPDGTQIVFTSYLRRQPDLFSIPAEGGRVKQLTNNSEMELGAEYSRDGRSLIASISGGGRTWLALFSANRQLTFRQVGHLT